MEHEEDDMGETTEMEEMEPEESGKEFKEEPDEEVKEEPGLDIEDEPDKELEVKIKKRRSSFELPAGFIVLSKGTERRTWKEYLGPDGITVLV